MPRTASQRRRRLGADEALQISVLLHDGDPEAAEVPERRIAERPLGATQRCREERNAHCGGRRDNDANTARTDQTHAARYERWHPPGRVEPREDGALLGRMADPAGRSDALQQAPDAPSVVELGEDEASRANHARHLAQS